MKEYTRRVFPNERDLYGSNDLRLVECAFEGKEDGESALKESSNLELVRCNMALRYPLWHCEGVRLSDCHMEETCRAPIWYSKHFVIENSELLGVKALRECESVKISGGSIVSPEFGWRSRKISIGDCKIEGEYPFFEARDLSLSHVSLTGKYSFQYVENMTIDSCNFATKDAFWHTKNVTVRNSVISGEYLGWYSENLTFENCKISGTQPLCYCKGLRLINCELDGADFAFEYSQVEADLCGSLISVKNPLSGFVTADRIDEILLTADSKRPCNCKITVRNA